MPSKSIGVSPQRHATQAEHPKLSEGPAKLQNSSLSGRAVTWMKDHKALITCALAVIALACLMFIPGAPLASLGAWVIIGVSSGPTTQAIIATVGAIASFAIAYYIKKCCSAKKQQAVQNVQNEPKVLHSLEELANYRLSPKVRPQLTEAGVTRQFNQASANVLQYQHRVNAQYQYTMSVDDDSQPPRFAFVVDEQNPNDLMVKGVAHYRMTKTPIDRETRKLVPEKSETVPVLLCHTFSPKTGSMEVQVVNPETREVILAI